MDPVHQDFFEGGAGRERTLAANERAFERRWIVPRVLRATGERDLRATVAGTSLAAPILVAPTAFHRLAHPHGEAATARGAAAAGTAMVVSMAATQPVEEIAAAGGTLWFQLYPQPDLDFTEYVVKRAESAGCRALVVTVDSPVFGRRERDRRNGFTDLPPGYACANMRDATGRVRPIAMDATAGWDRIAWLRGVTGLPILLKGVLHPADARLAVEHGAAGVIGVEPRWTTARRDDSHARRAARGRGSRGRPDPGAARRGCALRHRRADRAGARGRGGAGGTSGGAGARGGRGGGRTGGSRTTPPPSWIRPSPWPERGDRPT